MRYLSDFALSFGSAFVAAGVIIGFALIALPSVFFQEPDSWPPWTIHRNFLVWEDSRHAAHERYKARIPKSTVERWLKGACDPRINTSSIFYSPYRGIDIRLDCDK